jgi:hypothetical protein
VYLRGEGERASSTGALYLANIQQLHERGEGAATEPAAITALLGPRPPAQAVETVDFRERIAARGGPCLVVNDEADGNGLALRQGAAKRVRRAAAHPFRGPGGVR